MLLPALISEGLCLRLDSVPLCVGCGVVTKRCICHICVAFYFLYQHSSYFFRVYRVRYKRFFEVSALSDFFLDGNDQEGPCRGQSQILFCFMCFQYILDPAGGQQCLLGTEKTPKSLHFRLYFFCIFFAF